MKRSRHVTMRLFPVVACLFAAMLTSLLTSCGFNLDPSWSAARTSVSVTLAGAIPSAGTTGAGASDQGRAISTSSGFLYLQTGLTAETAKVYGPYSVSAGAAVTVTDIPAGAYPGMILLFVPTELLESYDPLFPGELTTDSARGAAQACLSGDPSALYAASIALIPNVDIKEGAKNQVGATLVPITNSTPDGDGNLSVEGSSGYVTRRFIRLDDVAAAFSTIPEMSAGARTAGSMGAVIKNMALNLRNLDETGSLTVSAVGLYDSTGKRIYRSDESINLAAYAEQTLYSVPWSGDNVYYAYVEFTGRGISCHFAESIVDLSTQALVTLDWNVPGYTTQTLETYGAGAMVYLPLCPATYPGHVFKGWAKTANATTPEYPKDSECSFPAGAITLYAVWEVDVTLTLGIASFSTMYTNTPTGVSVTFTIVSAGTGIKTINITGAIESLTDPIVQGPLGNLKQTSSGTVLTLEEPIVSPCSITLHGIDLDSTVDGLKELFITVTDGISIVSDSVTAFITLDTLAPTLTVTTTDSTYINSGTFLEGCTVVSASNGTLTVMADDGNGSGALSPTGSNVDIIGTVATVSGANYNSISVADNAGNYTTVNFWVAIDTTKPVVDSVMIDSTPYTSGQSVSLVAGKSYTFAVNASDYYGVKALSLDGITFQTGVISFNIVPVNGVNTYKFFAKDNVGNVSEEFTLVVTGI